MSNGSDFVELTRAGEVGQVIPVRFPGSTTSSEYLRDVIVAEDGRVAAYNGTSKPRLTILDIAGPSLTHLAGVDFSTVNDVTRGGIGVHEDFVFLTDERTSGSTGFGIRRIDLSDSSIAETSEGSNVGYTDLTVGLDGLVYANSPEGNSFNNGIFVYQPRLRFVRRIRYSSTLELANIPAGSMSTSMERSTAPLLTAICIRSVRTAGCLTY